MYTHTEKILSVSSTLSNYYFDELTEWKDLTSFYLNEMKSFSLKFINVIHRNSIIGIAEKVESHQIRLNHIRDKFNKILRDIKFQESILMFNDNLIDDDRITREIEKFQIDLRSKIQSVEKEYGDVKFDCYFFLAGVLKK